MMALAQKPDLVFRAKRTSPFKSAGGRGVSSVDCCAAEVCGISGSNAGYTMFRGSVKGRGQLKRDVTCAETSFGLSRATDESI